MDGPRPQTRRKGKGFSFQERRCLPAGTPKGGVQTGHVILDRPNGMLLLMIAIRFGRNEAADSDDDDDDDEKEEEKEREG